MSAIEERVRERVKTTFTPSPQREIPPKLPTDLKDRLAKRRQEITDKVGETEQRLREIADERIQFSEDALFPGSPAREQYEQLLTEELELHDNLKLLEDNLVAIEQSAEDYKRHAADEKRQVRDNRRRAQARAFAPMERANLQDRIPRLKQSHNPIDRRRAEEYEHRIKHAEELLYREALASQVRVIDPQDGSLIRRTDEVKRKILSGEITIANLPADCEA